MIWCLEKTYALAHTVSQQPSCTAWLTEPTEIGGKRPPVGWFARNVTLSSRQQANSFFDVLNLQIPAAAIL